MTNIKNFIVSKKFRPACAILALTGLLAALPHSAKAYTYSYSTESLADFSAPESEMNFDSPPVQKKKEKTKGFFIGGHDIGAAILSFKDSQKTGPWEERADFYDDRPVAGEKLLGLMKDTRTSTLAMDLNPYSQLAVGGMKSAPGFSSREKNPVTRGAAVSYTVRPAENWSFSLSNAFLKQSHTLLGSPDSGYLDLGKTLTMSMGVGASLDLGQGYTFGVDAVAASTSKSRRQNGLISGTSKLSSLGLSAALYKPDLAVAGDDALLTIQKPLRVHTGSARAFDPVTGAYSQVSLTPTGSETSFSFDYKKPLDFGGTGGVSLSYRHDADHIAGEKDAVILFRYAAGF